MSLKSQDILVLLKLLSADGRQDSFAQLGQELGVSASETHAAVVRLRKARLIHPQEDRSLRSPTAEFLIHALKYLMPVQPGGRTRGRPTGFAAKPLQSFFNTSNEDQDIYVWPDPEGTVSGLEITPLHRSAPKAAKRDSALYEWLVLADAMRGAGRAREKELAESIIRERLDYHASC